jgi:hypothetical protein
MRIIGCDFHTRQQALAMLDTETGEIVRMTLTHEGNHVRRFYSTLPRPVRVGNCSRTVIGFPPCDTSELEPRPVLVRDGCPIFPISHQSGTCLVTDSIQVGEP